MRPKNFSGEGTLLEAGTDATHGERNRASVVAFLIASVEPGSEVSAGGFGFCATRTGAQRARAIAQTYFMEVSVERVKFTISHATRQLTARGMCPRSISETREIQSLTPRSLETKQEGALV